ncbi:glycosyl transferase [Wenjunlia vitaminophila]|uniref:D-inositol 3-phosphate glycosyltransferase n=1 Tax=Wenjunlia vitaminophila TaxID=76728 RepID=A0A0T6LVA7_WENVI|nr:glycosyltransferase family 4 protein [Wenjunlia vitaminophila]KRV49644.1 glycosyl transferase [Wenjunlia vitaminophila]
MKISFLIHNAYGIGGTIRTTFNLAQGLAARGHEVEIVSVLRHREDTGFELDPRVTLRPLVDLREEKDDPLHQRPARVFSVHDHRHHQYSELTDRRVADFLRTTDAQVLVGTRPGLNVQLALQGPHRAVRVGQEHLTLDTHPQPLRLHLRRIYPRLDAITTVTQADAAVYRRKMRLPGVRVEALPNSVPEPSIPPVDGTAKVVIAAGRLAPVKRYDLLIRAFEQVVAEHPDWTLRIYGSGGQAARLRKVIDSRGLYNNVFLMGRAAPIEAEWAKGSISAVTSSFEGFGMTIVEAMRCGLPVVSTACPLGPPEIIQDGVDGRLVKPGNTKAIAGALLELIRDEDLRRRMGRAARENAARYDPGPVAEECERLFEELLTAGHGGQSLGRRTNAALLGAAYSVKDVLRTAKQPLVAMKKKVRG